MSAKDAMLQRIRRGLARSAVGAHIPDADAPLPELAALRAALPPVPATREGMIELFARHCKTLRTTLVRADDAPAATAFIRRLAAEEKWERLATHAGTLADAVCPAVGLPTLRTDLAYGTEDLARCDAGLTECEALIAQTGSVLCSTARSGGRALSVLPPHHVVLATLDQLMPDLAAGYEHLALTYRDVPPTWAGFITGPSRTGDIERILVLGAHGPKRLTVVVIDRAG